MASPSDLSLDYKPTNYSSAVQKGNNDQLEQTQKLQEFLARLEEERLKIEAFKRELPLCMQLLTNGTLFFINPVLLIFSSFYFELLTVFLHTISCF